MKRSKTSLQPILFVSILCLLSFPGISFAKIHHLTLLYTNNHEGHFTKFSWNGIPDVGGMAARSTLVNIVRAEVEEAGGHVLLLSPGLVNGGVPESHLLHAEPDFKLMSLLGYDAMTLSYFEFSNSREVLLQQQEWADFPFLSANAVEEESGERPFEPYIIKNFDDLRVAIFGLTLETTETGSGYAQELNFRNAIETARSLVPTLRAEADVVIALTNLRFSTSERWLKVDGDVQGTLQLAQEVAGIDVIIGAGTDKIVEVLEVVGNTLIVEASEYGLHVGRLDLTIDSDPGRIMDYSYNLIPVNLKKEVKYQGKSYYMYVDKGYVEDPAVLEFIQPYLAQVDELLSQPVGETSVKLDGAWDLVTTQETNLANLVTDAMRANTGAEIAIQNGGGIQTHVDIGPGPITYRDILHIHPWGSTLVLLDMTGDQILDVLTYAVTIAPAGGFPHTSGLTWTNNKGIPEDVMVGETPIEFERMYKVVTNSFIAGGGDGFTVFNDIPHCDTGFTNATMLREYIMKQGKVAPKVEGRLTIIE